MSQTMKVTAQINSKSLFAAETADGVEALLKHRLILSCFFFLLWTKGEKGQSGAETTSHGKYFEQQSRSRPPVSCSSSPPSPSQYEGFVLHQCLPSSTSNVKTRENLALLCIPRQALKFQMRRRKMTKGNPDFTTSRAPGGLTGSSHTSISSFFLNYCAIRDEISA